MAQRQMQDMFWEIATNMRRGNGKLERELKLGNATYKRIGKPVRLNRDHKSSIFACPR